MATSNFTKSGFKTVFLPFLGSLFYRPIHEIFSCMLSELSADQLLSLNGAYVEIQVNYPGVDLSSVERGKVVSVLIPSSTSSDMGILFLPNGDDVPYFPDITRTRFLGFLNR